MELLTPAVIYALCGGLAIKMLELAELHKIPKLERPDLRDWAYWVPFFVLPLLGAGLAHAYESSSVELTPLLAVNVGVSAPLVFRAMAQVNPMEANSISVPDDA
ncbi:MAG: hypothetical protein JJ921_18970 [Pseudomonadales bacterium]|nr:hypothetical protein [Pseudomonadales bacterium]MBO7007956.1 hypothetical protein [Pseudomonadales bacterium]